MSEEKLEGISESEVSASEKRAARLKEISEELASNADPKMAEILAEIAARNEKQN